jgi:cytochrome c nitrite reductase small subunit
VALSLLPPALAMMGWRDRRLAALPRSASRSGRGSGPRHPLEEIVVMGLRIPFNLLGVLMVASVGIMLGLGGATFHYAKGTSYLSNDPANCANCHIMQDQYDTWQKASHHTVATCNDCHVPHDLIGKYATKLENGYAHSKGFTFNDFHEPIQMRPQSKAILLKNCLHCHQEFVESIQPHDALATEQLDCIQCHTSVGHGSPR